LAPHPATGRQSEGRSSITELSFHGNTPLVGREARAGLDRLHRPYGRDQSLPDILDGLTRDAPAHANCHGRSLAVVVSGIYDKLDELRQLCGSKSKKYSTSGLIYNYKGGSIAWPSCEARSERP
jgi:hypothetical protein